MNSNNKLLSAVLVLQGLTLLGLWTGNHGGAVLPAADAQVLDSGARQVAMLEQLREINHKMERLVGVLEGGKLQVQVSSGDEKNEAKGR